MCFSIEFQLVVHFNPMILVAPLETKRFKNINSLLRQLALGIVCALIHYPICQLLESCGSFWYIRGSVVCYSSEYQLVVHFKPFGIALFYIVIRIGIEITTADLILLSPLSLALASPPLFLLDLRAVVRPSKVSESNWALASGLHRVLVRFQFQFSLS